jgi:DNA repair exonuclease SbcCD nuclease subunit
MKILHLSDTHLGYHDLDKINANGVNIREQDFYDAFAKCIDEALRHKVDVVIHSGDFFHRPSPANRPMIFALQQITRLSQAGIPFVVIAGNHETPKTIFTSPILEALQTVENVYPIFGQEYDTVVIGELVVHGLPHINDERVLLEEMDRIQPIEGKFNIIMLHTSIGKEYIMDEYGEQLYPPERIEMLNKFDYVALGHWHNYQKVPKLSAGWYSGSTERMGETEVGNEKGYCILKLEKRTEVNPEFHALPTRSWHKIEIKSCQEKTIELIENELVTALESIKTKEAIISLIFQKIKPLQSISLSNRRIQALIPDALHIHFKRHFVHEDGSVFSSLAKQTESIDELMEAFIQDKIDDEKRAAVLSEKARYYFNLYQTGEYKNR